jgi:hypothetical protein
MTDPSRGTTGTPEHTAAATSSTTKPSTPGAPSTPQAPAPPYVPPPLFPRPDLPPSPDWLLPSAGSVGLVAAISLPGSAPGLGLLLVAVASGVAIFPALRHRLDAWTATFAVLAYGLVAVAVVRDADWLVSLLLVAGFLLAGLAVSGQGRSWRGIAKGGLSVSLAVLPQPWFLTSALARVGRRQRVGPALVGVGLTVVLVAIFGALFSSADVVFSSYAGRLIVPRWLESWPERAFVFVVFGVLVAAAVLVRLRPVAEPERRTRRVRVGRTMWLLPLSALNLLFVSFVIVQISVLFGGQRQVLETAGMTYAEYARSGFFQLVWISVFVLAIVALVTGTLSVRGGDRWIIAGQLAALCGLTLVVLASALQRLTLYVDMYGQSRVRASVDATIFWLAAVFALVLLAGGLRALGRGRATWLPRTLVAMTAAGMVMFACWNPDLQVAQTQRNVRTVDALDADYLGGLGADAVPVLDTFPEPTRSCILQEVVEANALGEPDPWNGWNLARARARDILARNPVDTSVSCTSTYR